MAMAARIPKAATTIMVSSRESAETEFFGEVMCVMLLNNMI
jgi:hypothetical protein